MRGVDYQLDHIYSIYDGYKNNVDPKIISSIFNLQLITEKINKSKGKNSWIDKEELITLYEKSKNINI